MNLYNRIDDLCKSKDLTVYKMCKIANLSFSVIYDLKSGKKTGINLKTAEKIATALEISVDELYGKEKSPDAEAPRASEHIDFIELLDTLPEEEQKKVYEYLQLLSDKHKHR